MKALVLGILLVAVAAKADPIQDNVVNGYKAAWLPSSETPCSKVCSAADARAEGEKFVIASIANKATFVCKAEAKTGGAYAGEGWLYGNNFSSTARNKVCMVSTADGSVQRLQKFYCLCVY